MGEGGQECPFLEVEEEEGDHLCLVEGVGVEHHLCQEVGEGVGLLLQMEVVVVVGEGQEHQSLGAEVGEEGVEGLFACLSHLLGENQSRLYTEM